MPRESRRTDLIRAALRVGLVAFALLSIASGALKVVQPDVAALYLRSVLGELAPSRGLATALVLLFGAGQGAVGALLLAAPGARGSRLAGLALVASLSVFEIGALFGGEGGASCGCFGAIDVPGWLPAAVLACGAGSLLGLMLTDTAQVARAPLRIRAGFVGVVCAGLAGGAITGLVSLGGLLDEEQAVDELALRIAAEPGRAVVAVVGAKSCVHCCEFLGELAARWGGPATGDARIVLVASVRDGAPPRCPELERDVVAIDDEAWWALIDQSPPTVYVRLPGERPTAVEGVDGVLAALASGAPR